MPLKDKIAIVTGGNSGIGKAIALGLAKAGASIVIDYISDPNATDALEREIVALGDKAIGVDADVSHIDDLQKLVDAAVAAFGRVDVMVNNAGVETRTSVLETTEAQYDKVLTINLKSAFFGTQIAPSKCSNKAVVVALSILPLSMRIGRCPATPLIASPRGV